MYFSVILSTPDDAAKTRMESDSELETHQLNPQSFIVWHNNPDYTVGLLAEILDSDAAFIAAINGPVFASKITKRELGSFFSGT